jgi:tRNA A-37 threonylcarbamoyl transferase component Bud32
MSFCYQIGSGKCSICQSEGTNMTTCPRNPGAVKVNPTKHPNCNIKVLPNQANSRLSGPYTVKQFNEAEFVESKPKIINKTITGPYPKPKIINKKISGKKPKSIIKYSADPLGVKESNTRFVEHPKPTIISPKIINHKQSGDDISIQDISIPDILKNNPIYLDVTPTTLKKVQATCDPTYIIKNQLSTGGEHSTIKQACHNSKCDYIAKIIPIEPTPASWSIQPCLNDIENVENEMAISLLMSDANIGPKIYDTCITSDYGMLIMDRYDGSLSELLIINGPSMSEESLDDILKQIQHIISTLHKLNIVHRDIHTDNFLYKQLPDKSYKIVLSDYGLSLITDSINAKKTDLIGLKLIANAIEDIKEGRYYSAVKDIVQSTFSFESAEYDFTRNGKECSEWA